MYSLLRWFDPIPPVIIYDYSCDAERYCRRRSDLFDDSLVTFQSEIGNDISNYDCIVFNR